MNFLMGDLPGGRLGEPDGNVLGIIVGDTEGAIEGEVIGAWGGVIEVLGLLEAGGRVSSSTLPPRSSHTSS